MFTLFCPLDLHPDLFCTVDQGSHDHPAQLAWPPTALPEVSASDKLSQEVIDKRIQNETGIVQAVTISLKWRTPPADHQQMFCNFFGKFSVEVSGCHPEDSGMICIEGLVVIVKSQWYTWYLLRLPNQKDLYLSTRKNRWWLSDSTVVTTVLQKKWSVAFLFKHCRPWEQNPTSTSIHQNYHKSD